MSTRVIDKKTSQSGMKMKNISFPFNPLGTYAKVYHDLAKKYKVPPAVIKILMNSFYGNPDTK